MRQAATQPVQFVHDQTPDSPSADILQQPVEFGARGLGPGNLVGINNGVPPAPLAAIAFKFQLLAVSALALGGYSNVDGCVPLPVLHSEHHVCAIWNGIHEVHGHRLGDQVGKGESPGDVAVLNWRMKPSHLRLVQTAT